MHKLQIRSYVVFSYFDHPLTLKSLDPSIHILPTVRLIPLVDFYYSIIANYDSHYLRPHFLDLKPMAKCVGSDTHWKDQPTINHNAGYINNDISAAEKELNSQLKRVDRYASSISNGFLLLRTATLSDEIKLNCGQVQKALSENLRKLHHSVSTINNSIAESSLSHSRKLKYFLHFSCGVVARVQELLRVVGRIIELETIIFEEEYRRPLISEESATIHSLKMIWTVSIRIMYSFDKPRSTILNCKQLQTESGNDEDTDYIREMDFFNAYILYSEVLLMDLLSTSWIQFNRLVRYDDLERSNPFLCPCNCKAFLETLELVNTDTLNDLLNLILDYQAKPALLTANIRRVAVVPFEPFQALCDERDLAYFVVWNLCALSRLTRTDKQIEAVAKCSDTFEKALIKAVDLFPHDPSTGQTLKTLSSHQEERLKLLIVLVTRWCEIDTKRSESIRKHVQILCPKQTVAN